jgi:hypothetical protein
VVCQCLLLPSVSQLSSILIGGIVVKVENAPTGRGCLGKVMISLYYFCILRILYENSRSHIGVPASSTREGCETRVGGNGRQIARVFCKSKSSCDSGNSSLAKYFQSVSRREMNIEENSKGKSWVHLILLCWVVSHLESTECYLITEDVVSWNKNGLCRILVRWATRASIKHCYKLISIDKIENKKRSCLSKKKEKEKE